LISDEVHIAHLDLKSGEYVRLTVRDTGTGIPPDVAQHIFEPFFTTKEEGKGTGLGLSTMYGIARQHSGDINLETSPDKGTAFHIYFPCKNCEKVIESQECSTPLQSGFGETIVVVEENSGVRDLLNLVLNKNGYNVLSFDDAESCSEKLKDYDGPLDLLLSDVIVPHMNGPELHKELRKHYPELKVIFMSGHIEDEMTRCGILDLSSAFIIKPISIRSLTEKVRHVLDEKSEK